MKWDKYYGTIISIFISGVTTAYAMTQPKMSNYELMMYGVSTIQIWVRLIVAILIITWGYHFFKKINDI